MTAVQPLFVEIYSPNQGVWAWTVTFDELNIGRSGKASDFDTAMRLVSETIAHAQVVTEVV